jgi:hypothetical protein
VTSSKNQRGHLRVGGVGGPSVNAIGSIGYRVQSTENMTDSMQTYSEIQPRRLLTMTMTAPSRHWPVNAGSSSGKQVG